MKKLQHTYNNYPFLYYIRHQADQSIRNEIFVYQEYKSIYDTIKNTIYPIVDVWAHVGFFTLLIRCFNAKIPIYAIEASPENNVLFARHMDENKLTNITHIKAALTDKSGSTHLILDEDHVWNKVVTKYVANKTISVASLCLTDVMQKHHIEKIWLLKLDIEGGEYAVLYTIPDTLRSSIHTIFLEYHTDSTDPTKNHTALSNFLRQHWFGVQHFPSKFDKNLGFLLAVNKKFVG